VMAGLQKLRPCRRIDFIFSWHSKGEVQLKPRSAPSIVFWWWYSKM
jgi:hypothetical protein